MSNFVIIIAVIVFVLGVVIGLIPYIKNKGINTDKALDTAQKVIDGSGKILKVANEVLPNNPAVNILSVIEKWAAIAVGNAEQLNHTGAIQKDQRAAEAEKIVLNVIGELNIKLTDSEKELIHAAMGSAINDLGHKEPTEAEKAAEKEKLQQDITSLQNDKSNLQIENSQLKEKLSNIAVSAKIA